MRAAVYDQRLEAVAGKPAASRSGAGAVPLSLDNAAGITLYVAYATADTSVAYDNFAAIESATATLMVLQSSNVGNDHLRPRWNFAGNAQADTGVRVGRHSAVMTLSADGTVGTAQVAGYPGLQVATTPPVGVATTLRVFADGLMAAAYNAVHTPAQQTRILAWLARRYSVTPPRFFVAFLAHVATGWWRREGGGGGLAALGACAAVAGHGGQRDGTVGQQRHHRLNVDHRGSRCWLGGDRVLGHLGRDLGRLLVRTASRGHTGPAAHDDRPSLRSDRDQRTATAGLPRCQRRHDRLHDALDGGVDAGSADARTGRHAAVGDREGAAPVVRRLDRGRAGVHALPDRALRGRAHARVLEAAGSLTSGGAR